MGLRDEGNGAGKVLKKRIKICHVHVPTAHKKCKHYILEA